MNPNLPAWPASLPQDPYGDTPPEYKPQDTTFRTQNDTGPAKVRRRFTGRVHDVTVGPLQITAVQLDALEDFCCNTLGETMPFAWKNFRTGLDAAYRFKAGWSSVTQKFLGTDGRGIEWYEVSADLEMLP